MKKPNPTPVWFESVQPFVDSEQVAELKGKFHAHLTIEISASEVERLQQHCKQQKVKLTVVDLENISGQSQTDVMTTTYYRDLEKGAVSRITRELAETSSKLQSDGFSVIRAKLEHESLPSLPVFNDSNYHEVHVKLQIPGEAYQQTHSQLNEIGKTVGFVPSRNPLAQKSDQVIQFINQRIYTGTHDDADSSVAAMLKSIEELPVTVIEVKRETVVFDTHQKLDNWWI